MSADDVGPEDCAYCVGIPVTRRAFLESAEDSVRWDYVPRIVDGYRFERDGLERAWAEYQRQVAGLLESATAVFRDLGVAVSTETDLATLRSAARERRVVILTTHWRSTPFTEADVADAAGLLRRVLEPKSWIEKRLRAGLSKKLRVGWFRRFDSAVDEARRRGELLARVIDVLNEEDARARSDRDVRAGSASSKRRAPPPADRAPCLTRFRVEWELGGVLAEQAHVELSDGVQRVTDLGASLRDARTMDFSMCFSSELQDAFLLMSPDGHVVATYEQASIPISILTLKRTFDLLRARRRPYAQARMQASRDLYEELRR